MAERVPIGPDEQRRVQALLQYRILDTAPEPIFDNITKLIAAICHAPMVAITLLDEKRQWFKSRFGLEINESPREISFCAYTIAAKEIVVIKDTQTDPRFRDNPFVKSPPNVRFYAGVPLITPDGYCIGTIAVLDTVPRELDESQKEVLKLLAEQVMDQLEMRRRAAESNATILAIVRANPLPIIAFDLKRTVLMWNERAAQVFGYSSEEVLGHPLPTVPPEELVRFQSELDRLLLKGESSVHYEARRQRKDGAIVDVGVFSSAVRNEHGEIIGVVTIVDDITERKKIERHLVELGTTVEASRDAIVGGTLEGIITAWNRGAELMYGYTAQEIIGQSIAAMYPPEKQEEQVRVLETLKSGKAIQNLETVRVKKGGEYIPVSVTVSPVKDATGKPIGVSSIARDITEQRRSAIELERTLALMKATLEATADGILAVDLSGRIASYNQRFAELWRVPKEIFEAGKAQPGIEFVLSQLKDPEYFMEKSRRYFSGAQLDAYDLVEFKDGRVYERYLHPQVVGGEIVGYVFSYRDMTRRRQLEEQLRQAQKMEAVGQLAGGIAHDFNNLLNVIIGYSELTKMHLGENDPLLANIDHVMRAADRAASLTRQLLIFSRKQVPHLEVIDVNQIASNMSAMLRRLIGEDIELVMSLDANVATIKADAGQVEQVIMNLVINARDAMPKGGRVQIATSRVFTAPDKPELPGLPPGEYLVLSVEDTGTGMSEDVKQHIFEPFFTTKQPGKGTGLGLATVYGIAHQTGGDIEVRTALGQGATFRVFFPVVEQNASTSKNEATEAPRGREVILVVEDEESLRKLMCQALRQQGYTVLEAGDGSEALEVTSAHEGDLDMLITDVVMPGMRGWELARRITEMRRGVRVMYISGYTEHGVIDPDVLGRNAAFIQKPFTPTSLAQKVRNFLGNAKRVGNH